MLLSATLEWIIVYSNSGNVILLLQCPHIRRRSWSFNFKRSTDCDDFVLVQRLSGYVKELFSKLLRVQNSQPIRSIVLSEEMEYFFGLHWTQGFPYFVQNKTQVRMRKLDDGLKKNIITSSKTSNQLITDNLAQL
jgi:hypothetical protein